ncbi:MAG: glycosyltransferase family 4 protein [Armatimonadota bacterium]|nr:glycosyltransferase family 4 protein [Armatimonadota bacterium]MDR7428222.1 glycosyltransferase family 4 protein [Armatimonadota bacterium]MDR7470718.1 glycosyltransferase family 4 protein [Armatimonadota bacterium]MDR7475755.1 glycosyltransferase family 4 protein [Armatimonadota bacterium]MDR7540508.1 glycosyltransferase family 4 protein [Armatimonadota bacterium]
MGPSDGDVTLLVAGEPHRLTGGNLYNQHLCASLISAGVDVAVVTAPPALYPRVAIVDSISIAQSFSWIAARPVRTAAVALMHMLPSLHATSGPARLRWRRLEMAFLRRVDLAVVVGQDLSRWLHRFGVAGPVHTIPPGKDGPRPRPGVALGHQRKAGAGLRLLCVANWLPVKGLHVLIEALADLPPDVRLDLVGDRAADPAYARQVREAMRRHRLEDRVRAAGVVPPGEMGARYAAVDAFVLPSGYEGYPTALAEALWFGLPVVATAVGGIPDLISGGVEGILVPPGRPRALAGALRRLRDDPALRGRMAAAAAVRGQALPSWADTRAALRELLLSLLS